MSTEPVLSERWLVAGFAAVALWSLASSLYSQRSLVEVRTEAESLRTNALPSIEHLTAARTALRHLDIAIDHDLQSRSPRTRAALVVAISHLDREMVAYLALPFYPGERAQASEAIERIDKIKQILLQTSAERGSGPIVPSGNPDLMDAAIEQVDDALQGLILLNARQAVTAVIQSEHARRRSELVPLIIDVFDLGLAGLVAAMGVRAIRRYRRFRTEHERLLALRSDELEQFAARVVHDIRNPLNSLSLALGLLGRLQGDAGPDTKPAETLKRGVAAFTRVHRIVEGLYEFARAGARPQAGAHADAVAVLVDAASDVRPRAEEAAIDLLIEPVAGPQLEGQSAAEAQVACSPGLLTSVLTNLLNNAVKYMVDAPERRITARVVRQFGWVRIEIGDTGPGIPAEMQASIFEPYIRAPGLVLPGLGLGLATVKRIVQAHDGKMGVRSAPGQGSLFWFEMPAAGARPVLLPGSDPSPAVR